MSIRYRIDIDAVDRSAYVQPGVQFENNIGGRGTCRFNTIDQAGSYAPTPGETIDIIDESVSPEIVLWTGIVAQVAEQGINGTGCLTCSVSGADLSEICDRRIVVMWYPIGSYGGTLDIVVSDLVTRYLADYGYSFDAAGSTSAYIGELLFDGITLREAFNKIAQIAGCAWKIQNDSSVLFFKTDDGAVANATTLSDANANYLKAEVANSRSTNFANRVLVKGSSRFESTWTDTHVGDGVLDVFPTTYGIQLSPPAAPTVAVNGVTERCFAQSVVSGLDPSEWDWYYIPDGGVGIFQNTANPVLTASDTLTIEYPTRTSYFAIAENAASILADGLFEVVIEDREAQDLDALQGVADAKLAEFFYGSPETAHYPQEISVDTRMDGYEPSQLVTVAFTVPSISGQYLCQSVSGRMVLTGDADLDHVNYTLKLTNLDVRKASVKANPASYMQRIIDATRQKSQDASGASEIIGFNLAATISGLTNPGVEAGLKPGSMIVQKGGTLQRVSIYFPDPADTSPVTSPTTTLRFDVFKNGSTIFSGSPPDYIEYPAGTTGIVERFDGFSSSPLTFAKGDVITLEPIDSDSQRMDGILELVIQ